MHTHFVDGLWLVYLWMVCLWLVCLWMVQKWCLLCIGGFEIYGLYTFVYTHHDMHIHTHCDACTRHIKLWCCTSASVKIKKGRKERKKSKKKRMANGMHTTYKVTINTQTFLNVHAFLINTPN